MGRSLQFALPVLIVQLSLPLLLWVKLVQKFRSGAYRGKDRLSEFNKNYSYFFLDYSEPCYYWEFIWIFQKISFIFVIIAFTSY